jgi:uncharacterized protein (TIGR02600 family)
MFTTPSNHRRRGASLIIVLIGITLISILLVAFLATVRTEVQSSKVYASGTSLKLLANSAVNLVQGQIRVATGDSSLNWASQPGMLRTWNTSGTAVGYYKLYSDSGMQGVGAFDHTLPANGVATNWSSQRGVYTDLNQPVRVGSTNYYPIMSGEAADLADYSSNITGGTVKALGPVTAGRPAVEGFWLKNAPVDASSPNQAPMPVKWLYVLQDGQIITPESSTGGVVSFSATAARPSATNQIVGRMAFWTDDETCKINVNTASEGAFWDTPRTYTVHDYYLATRQPVQGEFQRYPGHPATVSLSTVFGLSTAGQSWTPSSPFSNESLYPVTPATKAGGSQGGTVDSSLISLQPALPASVNRLYNTVDEFLFQPGLASGARKENAALLDSANAGALEPADLRKSRFFLTANSQAPDVNVFNLPRVSMWPITLDPASGAAVMTPYDKLISFCTTVNSHRFYFQRQDPTSPTVDLPATGAATGLSRNRQLLEYLRTLTALTAPGFGGTFTSKYGDDRHQILTEIFDYIRTTNLQDTSTGATPYARQIATSPPATDGQPGKGQVVPIIDSATTVTDSLSSQSVNPKGFGRFPTLQQAALVFIGAGDANYATYNPNTYVESPAGSGKYVTTFPGFPETFPAITASGTNRVQAGVFLQMYDPSNGTPITYPWYEVVVEGLDSLAWSNDPATSHPMGLPATGTLRPGGTAANSLGMPLYGGVGDYRMFSYGKNRATVSTKYPFIARPSGAQTGSPLAPVGSPDMNNQIYFKGGSATVKIYALDAAGNRTAVAPIQTLALQFPAATIPVPQTVANSATALNVTPQANYNFRSFYDAGSTPFGRLGFDRRVSWISSKDVVRAVVATPGDLRLIAARQDVPDTFFQPLGSYGTVATPSPDTMSHMLRFGLAYPVYGAAGGKLVNVGYSNFQNQYLLQGAKNVNDTDFYGSSGNATYYRSKDTSVPSLTGVTAAGGVPADWDNGVGSSVDGPFINKADEGDAGRPGDPNGRPYFELDYGSALPGPTFFSPNRMIPSPAMLGSLPTGVLSNKPWQTLLFRAGPANHPGLASSSSPPDHLLLDLFTMPVVEPYAISTPLATAGRINLNHLIVPFTYINRDTGLRAAMKSQMVTVIPSPTATKFYKNQQNPNGTPSSGNMPSDQSVRFPLDADKTLSQFQSRFNGGDIFRSASEICSIDLVPVHPSAPSLPITRANMDAFWAMSPVTGDNVRERPYANLYPLLTTKSNTYTVHYRVQSLKQTPGGDYTTWREDRDVIQGQLRGSQTIERYIDPNDSIPDYADPAVVSTSSFPPAQPLGDFYKFRVLSTRQFAP